MVQHLKPFWCEELTYNGAHAKIMKILSHEAPFRLQFSEDELKGTKIINQSVLVSVLIFAYNLVSGNLL